MDYVLACMEKHRDFLPYIKGIHLNQSLTGAYVRDLLAKQDQMPQTYRQKSWESHGHGGLSGDAANVSETRKA